MMDWVKRRLKCLRYPPYLSQTTQQSLQECNQALQPCATPIFRGGGGKTESAEKVIFVDSDAVTVKMDGLEVSEPQGGGEESAQHNLRRPD